MSRGLGRREKSVLKALDRYPGKWVNITAGCGDRSRASALRRAVRSLERRGLVETERRSIRGRSRLVVRRRSEPVKIIPDDIGPLLDEEERLAWARAYGAFNDRWEYKVKTAREEIKNQLHQIALDSGMTMKDIRTVLMAEKYTREVNAARGWDGGPAPETGDGHGATEVGN